MHHDIAVWFLVLSLFLPRLALLIAYCNGCIPPNDIPFWGDFFMALLIPRILIIIYIITNMGFGGWAVAHIIMAVITMISIKVRTSKRSS
jgi:hypothetical protein